jgi:hypothetical protein
MLMLYSHMSDVLMLAVHDGNAVGKFFFNVA